MDDYLFKDTNLDGQEFLLFAPLLLSSVIRAVWTYFKLKKPLCMNGRGDPLIEVTLSLHNSNLQDEKVISGKSKMKKAITVPL